MLAGGVLASAGYAQADSAAGGNTAGSPGVLSGNSVQVPVHLPVSVCGNTVDVVGLLNPAMGNGCANTSGGPAPHAVSTGARPGRPGGATADGPGPDGPGTGRAGATGSRSGGGAHASGSARNSPGVLSGGALQLPVDLPVNVSGNSVNVVGVGNPAIGNTAANGGGPTPADPGTPPPAHLPITAPPNVSRPRAADPGPTLAHTGAEGVGYATGASAGLLLGGAVLYRRFRPGRD